MLHMLWKLFGRPAWKRLAVVVELLVIDLLLGIVAMLTLFIFSKVAEWLSIDAKEVLLGITFAHLFRIGHAMNIIVVVFYSLRHIVGAYRNDHE